LLPIVQISFRDSSAVAPIQLAEGFANSKSTSKDDDKQDAIFLLAGKQLTCNGPIKSYINREKYENDQQ
jgi:hypothetical protein